MTKLFNKNCIITGASQGLGLAIAENFVKQGACVVLCARNLDLLKQVKVKLQLLAKPNQIIHIKLADISKAEDVTDLIEDSINILGRIDIIVNNAGIHGQLGLFEDNDLNKWIETLQTNLFGTVSVCKAIIPHMKQNKYGKIINLSGGGATSPLPHMSAYATSKVAVVRFSEILAIELKDYNIDVNTIAPGTLNTQLNRDVLSQGSDIIGKDYYTKLKSALDRGGDSIENAAALAVYLASHKSDGITGRLISAPWDPWQDLENHKSDLDDSDIYTLRRIVPDDRGKKF